MPILRSREIPSLPNSSSCKTLDKGFIEPSTPSKTTESLGNQIISSPNSAEFEFNSTPTSAVTPRRSSRLASKLDFEEKSSNSSVKRSRNDLNDSVFKSSIDVKDVESNDVNGSGSITVGESSVRVSDSDVISTDSLEEVKMKQENGGSHSEMEKHNSVESQKNEELESTRRRFTLEEKGKGVMSYENNVSYDFDLNIDLNEEMEGLVNEIDNEFDVDPPESVVAEARVKNIRDRFKDIARRNAVKYAHFSQEEENHVNSEVEEGILEEQPVANVEDWPGPFSTAMKIIRDREKNSNSQVPDLNSVNGGFPLVSWVPKKERDSEYWKKAALPPPLQSLCLSILSKNVDAISSLYCVPDVLRNRLSRLLCDSRKMNPHFLDLLLEGSPSEIRLADCSWLEERVFERSFEACNTSNLAVLQLDLCGHCLSDSSLRKTLVSKKLPALTTISLKGACRISDLGLAALASSAPILRSINLSQCCLLTDVGIDSISNSLGSIVQELYLDDCDTLNAMHMLPMLQRMRSLEVLSLRGIVSVSDKFIRELLSTNGQNLKELVLADCVKLTDSSLKAIAEKCSQLRVLDLSQLGKLTDIGMAHLTNGCRGIQDLNLRRCSFSDDAIAAFLEASGDSLLELSLNNIPKIGQNTTLSLARCCKYLESLDLSWCRLLTDEALGLIADSCLSLKLLKLFGCTQVSNVFVDGHSNPRLHIVGLQLTPILEHIKRPDFQQGPSN